MTCSVVSPRDVTQQQQQQQQQLSSLLFHSKTDVTPQCAFHCHRRRRHGIVKLLYPTSSSLSSFLSLRFTPCISVLIRLRPACPRRHVFFVRSFRFFHIFFCSYVGYTHGRRAFSVAGPTVWNSLPDFIRDPTISADCFRRLLKTYLFARY